MGKEYKIISIVIAVLLVNGMGIILRLNNLDPYIIILGFRFHISLIIPFFVVFRFADLGKLKQILLKPLYNKTLQPLLWIFIPFVVIVAVLYLWKNLEIGDPEYFYEFGLSSIFDLPVYFIWNLAQLLMFVSFLLLIQPQKINWPLTSLIIILLFAFEFIPLGKENFDCLNVAVLILSALNAGLLLKYFQNVYWFSVFFFMLFWLNLLAFGTDSQTMLHLLFASQYEAWEGFFDVAKEITDYLLTAQMILSFIILFISSRFLKTNYEAHV